MKITKLGHCCLIIEINGLRILTDPGVWTTEQNSIKNIDVVLITHEHSDHLHIESVKEVLANNPSAKIYTNSAVGKILAKEGITFNQLEKREQAEVQGVSLEAFDGEHGKIYPGVDLPQNTGYFIGGRFFYPGDSLYNPKKEVEALALPVAGPWIKISEAIDYAIQVRPKKCFPVHDGMLKFFGPFHMLPEKFLGEAGIEFIPLKPGGEIEFS